MINQKYFSIPPLGWFAISMAAVWAVTTANPLLTLAGVLLVPIFITLVWRKAEPPILFFCLFAQWAEVMTSTLKSDRLGERIQDIYPISGIEVTVWLSLIGLAVMALGMRFGIKGLKTIPVKMLFYEVQDCSINKVFLSYVLSYAVSLFLKGFMWSVPGLSQFVYAIFNLKWVFFFLLAYLTLYKKQKRYYLLAAFFFEVSIGMISFFAEFKQPFIILIIVYLTLGRKLTFNTCLKVGVLFVWLIGMGIVWSSVKPEYRNFINEGTGEQVVTVPVSARINKIKELYLGFSKNSFADGAERLADRLSYVEFFAMAHDNVPRIMEHENGALLWAAIRHVLMPRIFFPSKPVVDQTGLTTRYTGVSFGPNTAVSLGYMAENYIDFGVPGMYVPVFVLGCIWGLMYRYFLVHAKLKIFGFILATAVLVNANSFGINLVILVGGLTMNFLMMVFFMYLVVPILVGWLSRSGVSRHR